MKIGHAIRAITQGDTGEFVDMVGLRLEKTVRLVPGKTNTVVQMTLDTVSGDTKVVRWVRDNMTLNAIRTKDKYFELKQGDNGATMGVIELPPFTTMRVSTAKGLCTQIKMPEHCWKCQTIKGSMD
jgi:carboxyl-terminal processing protease